MSQSPLQAGHADAQTEQYLDNWNSLAARIRQGASFSGREPNCCFLNTGATRFADVSAALGLDYADDGRGLALVDWDHDGDLDLWVANRTSPSVRLLRNDLGSAHHYVAFHLEGVTCNRDAIGARVEVVLANQEQGRRIKTLRAGEGFLSQSSKWLHFGLGTETRIDQVRVEWPGQDQPEVFRDIQLDRHQLLKQGQAVASPVATRPASHGAAPAIASDESTGASSAARIVLTQRRPLPELPELAELIDRVDSTPDGGARAAARLNGQPTLLLLWASWCQPCLAELSELAQHAGQLQSNGLRIVPLNTDAVTDQGDGAMASRFVRGLNAPFRWTDASVGTLRDLTNWQHAIFYRQRPLPLPCSFLLDRQGRVAVIYHGPAKVSQLLADLQLLDASSSALLQAALPLGGRNIIRWFSPDPLRIAEAYAEGDYLDEAAAELHKLLNTTTDSTADRAAANRLEAWQLLAQIAQRRGDAKAELTARQTLAESAPEKSEYALQWALALARHGQTARARDILQSLEADAAESADQLALLGQAYLQMGQFAPSIGLFERALALQPERADHRFGLAMALQAAGQPERAMQSYRQLLSQQPQLHAAANNLAWLLATQPTSDDVSGQQEAVELAARICQETGNTNSSYLDTLSMALAARGDWPRAEQTLRTAIDVARSRGETEMVQKLRRRLADFQQRRRGA